MAETSRARAGHRAHGATWLWFPLAVWSAWRLLHALVLVAAGGDVVDDALSRWDANWYMTVLEHGWTLEDPSYTEQQNVAFFPGVVWLTEPLTWLVPVRTAALVVANLTSAAAFVALHGALRAVLGELCARRGVIGLALWPASIFLTAYYTEGLFITATAVAIWAERRGRVATGSVSAFVAALTRSTGFLVGPVCAAARFARLRRLDGPVVAYAISGPLGLALVAAAQWHQVGDPFAFAKAHSAWDRELAAPWLPLRRAAGGVLESLPRFWNSFGLDLFAIVAVTAALMLLTWRLRRRREAWPLIGWGWATWLVPMFTSLPSSQSRFALAAWPALGVLGTLRGRRERLLLRCGAGITALASILVVVGWTNGTWIA